MLSEQRLHPTTILFDLGKQLRNFALPGVLVMLGASRSSGGPEGMFGRLPSGWEVWMMALLVPALVATVVRYLSFRLRYDHDELVIRSGILFRNERHIPFSRIQNLDAVQHVFHRLFDVVEVRVETGGGKSEEARLSVLPRAAFDEMRQRVFAGRRQAAAVEPGAVVPGSPAVPVADAGETLLHLPLRELLLCGFLENKGMVLIGAAYGFLWESGWLGRVSDGLFGGQSFGRGILRDMAAAVFEGGPWPAGRLAIAVLGLVGALLLVRLLSMTWAFVRLYDFRLTRVREDLRIQFGLFTRVTATIPLRRIQTITIRQGLLHRWLARASVRVDTAGGTESETSARDRTWLAPIVSTAALPALLNQLVPGFDLEAVSWQKVHPRAFRRALAPRLIAAAIVTLIAALLITWGAVGVLTLMLVWAVVGAYQFVANLEWAEADEVVLKRSGWLVRRASLARVNKIQAVETMESPFDRRAAMARVRVDTAGAGEFSHRVDIPYLPRDVAAGLAERLAAQAANTAFKW